MRTDIDPADTDFAVALDSTGLAYALKTWLTQSNPRRPELPTG